MHQQRTPKVRAVFAALLLGSVISVAGFGATVSYQAEAAADAYRQVEQFLSRHLR